MENNSNQDEVLKILKDNQRLLIDNNKILRSLRRSQWVSLAVRTLWLAFILGSLWYSYAHYIAPNLEEIQNIINNMQQTNFNQEMFTDWLDAFRGEGGI